MSNLKFLKNNYVTKGQLNGFPLETIDKMIEYQVQQGNEANVEIFERCAKSDDEGLGFSWENTEEGFDFWLQVIKYHNFSLFFEKYPRNEDSLPRVIDVKNSLKDKWCRRVVFAFKNNKALCWNNAETLEEAENVTGVTSWKYWNDVEEEKVLGPEYEAFDFSNGVGDYLDLLGKRIISIDGSHAEIINEINYDYENNRSTINNNGTYYYFDDYVFEDGTPVGMKI